MAEQAPPMELHVPMISITAPRDRAPDEHADADADVGLDFDDLPPPSPGKASVSLQPNLIQPFLSLKGAVRSSSESGLPVSPTAPRSPKAFRSLIQSRFLVRSKSDKLLDTGDKWLAVTSVLKRKNYVPPPYASFVSRQLHKYLTLVNPEDNETATGFSLSGAVLFSDASGFTALTERLAARPNGAEELCEIINKFFAQLIEIVDKYAGDIVKFAGDAVCIVWSANAAEANSNNGYTSPDLATATLRACACCIELHQALHDYVAIDDPDPAKRVHLQLHMGLGCGKLTAVHVGGVFRRWEYILAGSPMAQIAIAAPMARPGETVVSAEAWELVHTMVSGISVAKRAEDRVPSQPGYHVLVSVDVDVPIPMFPTLLPITEEIRELMKRYIPHAVLPKLDSDHSGVLAELRDVSVVFVNVLGVELGAADDEHISEAVQLGQSLMLEIQRTVYSHEGSINKLLVDDKGLLVLCAWGLPPMPHPDDAVRSVAAALDLVENLKRLGEGVHGRVGVATGKAFCGVVGSLTRREYTLMGDSVNLAARLMSAAEIDGVLVDETTQCACAKLANNPFTFRPLAEKLYLKGKAALVDAFHPIVAPAAGPVKDKAAKKRENNSARDKEISIVTSSLLSMIEKKGGVMFVTGDRGSGKTVLVDRLIHFGKTNGMVVLCSQDKSTVSTKYVPNDQNVQRHLERHYERLKKTSELELAAETGSAGPRLFTAWRCIIEDLLRHACEATGMTRADWICDVLRGRSPGEENLTFHTRLLSLVIPDVEGLDRRPSERSDVLAVLETMLLRMLLAFAERFRMLIVLHLKTGTAAATAVDPESWSLAKRVSSLCVNRAKTHEFPMVLCVSTRPVTKARAESDVKLVFNLAQETGCVMMLKPLDSFARDKYAAQVLGIETQREIPVVALPPILLQFLSDRAAGNPKHIQEMMLELLNPKSPAVRVLDNGRVEVLRSLDLVETPLKVRGAVKQEYDLLPVELQSVCRAAIGLRSFTPCMVLELMQRAADLDVGSRPCTHSEVTQYFADLVEFGVFETTQQPTQCVRRYYPRDMTGSAFQFVSRLLQNEIAQYQPAVWRNRLEAVVRERTERVMSAYEKLIRFFRRLRDRRLAQEQKRLFRAAYIIQSKFRERLRRQMSGNGMLRQQSLPPMSAMRDVGSQPINITVCASTLKMPSRATTPSPSPSPMAASTAAGSTRTPSSLHLAGGPIGDSVVDDAPFSPSRRASQHRQTSTAAPTLALANGHQDHALLATLQELSRPSSPFAAGPAATAATAWVTAAGSTGGEHSKRSLAVSAAAADERPPPGSTRERSYESHADVLHGSSSSAVAMDRANGSLMRDADAIARRLSADVLAHGMHVALASARQSAGRAVHEAAVSQSTCDDAFVVAARLSAAAISNGVLTALALKKQLSESGGAATAATGESNGDDATDDNGGADGSAGATGSGGRAHAGQFDPPSVPGAHTPTAESPVPSAHVTPRSLLVGHTHDIPFQAYNGHVSGESASSSPEHLFAGAQHVAGLVAIGLLPTRTPTPLADSGSARDSSSPQPTAPHHAHNTRRASQPAVDPSASLGYPVSPNSGREVLVPGSTFSKSTSAPPTILRRLSSSASSPGPGMLSPARSFVTINNTMVIRNTGRRLPELPDTNL